MNLTEAQLNRFVDERYVERGRAYFERGLVVLGWVTERCAEAFCIGGQVYRVELSLSRSSRLGGNCTCPAVGEFGPCKHIAAVALAIMAGHGAYKPSRAAQERVMEFQTLRQHLLDMDKADLVDLVFSLTSEEELLWLIYDE